VNDESGGMWEEAAVDYFKVLSQHLPGRIEENHEKPVVIASPQQVLIRGTCQT
jgi:aspartate/glutamate racemase